MLFTQRFTVLRFINIHKLMAYTKLFSSILASSVWQETLPTKIVWVTMLALKNERHEVEASLPGLAKLAGVTLEECEEAVKKFEGPDKYSRNEANDGRKVVRVTSGWKVLNGDHYSRLMSADERREYQREYQREYRKKQKFGINGMSIREAVKKKVEEDPITISDRAAMAAVEERQRVNPPVGKTLVEVFSEEEARKNGSNGGETVEQRRVRLLEEDGVL